MVSGPDLARMFQEFESDEVGVNADCEFVEFPHHEQSIAKQLWYQHSVTKLVESMHTRNPFKEGSDALLNIGSGEYADKSVVSSMKDLEKKGKEQYTKYWDDVIKK